MIDWRVLAALLISDTDQDLRTFRHILVFGKCIARMCNAAFNTGLVSELMPEVSSRALQAEMTFIDDNTGGRDTRNNKGGRGTEVNDVMVGGLARLAPSPSPTHCCLPSHSMRAGSECA